MKGEFDPRVSRFFVVSSSSKKNYLRIAAPDKSFSLTMRRRKGKTTVTFKRGDLVVKLGVELPAAAPSSESEAEDAEDFPFDPEEARQFLLKVFAAVLEALGYDLQKQRRKGFLGAAHKAHAAPLFNWRAPQKVGGAWDHGFSLFGLCLRGLGSPAQKAEAEEKRRRRPMNNNYRRGYNFELRVKRSLEKRGYFVVRSSGSHGPADLLAVSKDGKVLAVQCKLDGYLPAKEFKELLVLASRFSVITPVLAKKEGRRISLKKLTAEDEEGVASAR